MKLAFSQARAVAKGTPEHWLGGRLARAASSASSSPPPLTALCPATRCTATVGKSRRRHRRSSTSVDEGGRGEAKASSAEEQSQWTMAGHPGYLVQSQSTASCNALTSA